DSACMLPPVDIRPEMVTEIKDATTRIALELGVRGLLNIQFAIKDAELYVIEVNPRASRTAPFVSKAIGLPLPGLATRVMCGKTLRELGVFEHPPMERTAVKEAVLPFSRFVGAD